MQDDVLMSLNFYINQNFLPKKSIVIGIKSSQEGKLEKWICLRERGMLKIKQCFLLGVL